MEFSLLWSFLTVGGVVSVACQGFLFREACVGVLEGDYWIIHSIPERRNPAPRTRTPIQASLTRKPWQATCTNPPTVRKLHNKENSTNSQNTERPPQTQQYKQDEETEEYSAGKGTGEMPSKPNKRGRDRESTWARILNIDSENDPKSWNQNGITDK